jgi:hypothetical protein
MIQLKPGVGTVVLLRFAWIGAKCGWLLLAAFLPSKYFSHWQKSVLLVQSREFESENLKDFEISR